MIESHLDQDTKLWNFPVAPLREQGIRPVVCGINTLCRAVEFTDFVRDVDLQADVTARVFRGADHSAIAVWSNTSLRSSTTPEGKYVLRAPLNARDVEILDMMGRTLKSRNGSREIAVPFDGCPAYIVSRNLSGEQLCAALEKGRITAQARE